LKDLELANSKLRVSVLCPSLVKTAIADSQRNRPSHLAATNPDSAPFDQRVRAGMDVSEVSAADVAEMTLEAVCEDQFYILPHPAVRTRIEQRFRAIVDHPKYHTTGNLAWKADRT
jgi:short-subunit dehydrogenase